MMKVANETTNDQNIREEQPFRRSERHYLPIVVVEDPPKKEPSNGVASKAETDDGPEVPPPAQNDNKDPTPNDEPNRCCCCCRRCCCCCCNLFDGNREAMAWAMDTVASSLIFSGSGAFLITTLIKLAKYEAGCDIDMGSDAEECEETVRGSGLKPSSLITTYATVIGLVAAIMMPVVGAVVDTTHFRLGLGRVSAGLFCAAVFASIFVSVSNWFAMSIGFAVIGFVGWFETMVLYAYLPELTSDESTLNRYTRSFAVLAYVCMVLYLGLVTGIAAGWGYLGSDEDDELTDEEILDNDIKTTRIAQSISFGVAIILLGMAWGGLFQPRPPARQRKPNENILTSGFIQLYQTARKVCEDDRYKSLQWFYVAVCLCEAATQSLFLLCVTFFTDQLDFSAAKTGTVLTIMLLASIPGAYLSSLWSRRYNPVSSSIAAIAILIVTTTLAAIFLKGPSQQDWAYLFGAGWGIGLGWKWTCDRLLYAMILPVYNQNAEFSGAYVFFRQCLTWLPPLIFTVLNESKDISMRWSMASLNIFFVLAFVVYGLGVKWDPVAHRSIAASNTAGSHEEGVEPVRRVQEKASSISVDREAHIDVDSFVSE